MLSSGIPSAALYSAAGGGTVTAASQHGVWASGKRVGQSCRKLCLHQLYQGFCSACQQTQAVHCMEMFSVVYQQSD